MASRAGWARDAARSRSCAPTRSCSSWGQGSRGMLVLDTHALIWAHAGIRIPKKVAKRIEVAGQDNELFISAITPWEIALGVRRGRIKIAGDIFEWVHDALDALSAVIASLEPAI